MKNWIENKIYLREVSYFKRSLLRVCTLNQLIYKNRLLINE